MSFKTLNKVLLVDDDPAMLRLLSAFLTSDGYTVFSASNGQEAIQIASREEPSFLITDWDMPGMDGLELASRVRSLNLQHYIYIVFITGRAGDEDLRQAMDVGADDFLVKPIRKQELLARLQAGARVVRLESRLSTLATQDTLTGLLIRRAFNRSLDKEWYRARRSRSPLSIVMFDIDHFKRINDTLGHPAGDEVIHRVAGVIRSGSRKSDVVCRYGGEEFCVFLPDTDEHAASRWADRILKQIADTCLKVGDKELKITVSAGVAGMISEMDEPEDLLQLSDQCLLAAKQAGRNRVVSPVELRDLDDATANGSDKSLSGVTAGEAMIPLFHSLNPEWSITRGAEYLLKYRVASAPVTDPHGNVLGVLLDRDVLRIADEPSVEDRRVMDLMRTDLISFEKDTPLEKIYRFMLRASVRNVLITETGVPCGMVSRSVLIRWLLNHGDQPWELTDRQGEVGRPSIDSAAMREIPGGSQPLLMMSAELANEATLLHRSLHASGESDLESAQLVGRASRMQQLVEEMLAASGSVHPLGGGVPF